MHNALHPRDDVDRLYVSRKEGGRGLTSNDDSVDASIQRLEDYIEKHEGGLITITRNDTDNTKTNRMIINKNGIGNNSMNVLKLISNISLEKTWTRLRKRILVREIESLLRAAENNAIGTNNIKARIDKMQQSNRCRLCGDRDETINHIITECSKLAQKDKKRLGEHGDLLGIELEVKFDHTNKWYMDNPDSVPENETHKLHLITAR